MVNREVSRAIERIEGARRPANSRTQFSVATLEVIDYGINNILQIETSARPNVGGTIVFKGNDNRIEIAAGCRGENIHFELGLGSSIAIDDDCRLSDLFVFAQQNGAVHIASGTNMEAGVRLMLTESGRILIGKDCLFANHIDMMTSDMHSIVSVEAGERLNPAADIVLEDHVWVSIKTMVLKGSHIGRGSIIGACSVVTGKIPENCIAVGAPARVIRKGVTWRTELLPLADLSSAS